jgi:hypothetical protein
VIARLDLVQELTMTEFRIRLTLFVSAVLIPAASAFAADAAAVKAYTPKLTENRTQRNTKAALPSYRAGLARAKEYWMAPVTADELARVKPKAGTTLAGLHRSGANEMLAQGEWGVTAEGRTIYRAALRSPEAQGIRLHVREFSIGAGKVWLHDGEPDGSVAGPYTARGPFGDGDFWTDVVFGESVVLEYEAERGPTQVLPFQIAEFSHVLANLAPDKLPDAAPQPVLNRRGEAETGLGLGLLRAAGPAPNKADALSCNVDATCHPQWAERAKSVARYLFETSGGTALCSGSLINTRNSSGKLYFLTADHCVSTEAEARSIQTFWSYATSTCNGPAPSTRTVPTGLGATYLTSGGLAQGDYSLLELREVPPGVTFAGWTPAEHPISSLVTGIHHPRGDFRRISFGARAQSIPTRSRPDDKFYTIIWERGVTEGGSSGSPVFNDEGLIVGMLSGGPRPPDGQTECDLRPAFDWYGRLSVAFPAIQSYLEDRQVGTPPQSGPAGTALASATPRQFSVGPVTGPTLFGGDNVFRIDVPQGATRLEIQVRTTTPGADIDLFVRRTSAPTASQGVQADHRSTGDTGDETVVITPTSTPALQTGTYYIALGLFTTGVTAQGTATAAISTALPPRGDATPLLSGVAQRFTLAAVNGPTLINSPSYRVTVPPGAIRLRVQLRTSTSGVDVDLHARFDREPEVSDGRVISEHSSTSESGNEDVSIAAGANPQLRAGTYFISLAVFTANRAVEGTITAFVDSAAGPPDRPTMLTSGVPGTFTYPADRQPTLYHGNFRVPGYRTPGHNEPHCAFEHSDSRSGSGSVRSPRC